MTEKCRKNDGKMTENVGNIWETIRENCEGARGSRTRVDDQIWLAVRRLMPLDRVDTVDRFVDGLAVLFRGLV